MEQSQPLVPLAANNNAVIKPIISLDSSPAITITLVKSSDDGKSMIIHLRSVSNADEKVRLMRPDGKSTHEVVVPANGMLVVNENW
jgi:hypothetical protein